MGSVIDCLAPRFEQNLLRCSGCARVNARDFSDAATEKLLVIRQSANADSLVEVIHGDTSLSYADWIRRKLTSAARTASEPRGENLSGW